MDAKVIWSEGLRFTGSAGSGFELPLDSGSGGGFGPLELLAIGLAGCTAMDVISILHKKKQDVTGFHVQVRAEQQIEHPHVFTAAKILYLVTGYNVDEAAVRRAIELSTLKYCPAQAMLAKAFPMELFYEIFADLGNGATEVLQRGQSRDGMNWLPSDA